MKKNIFYVPIFVYQCTNWEHKKLLLNDLLKSIEKNINFFKSVHTDYHFNKTSIHTYNDTVSEIFKDEINLLKNDLKISNNHLITRSWFEISHKYNSHSLHNHGISGYSSVCYIEYNPNSHSPTIFKFDHKDPITGKDQIHEVEDVVEGSIIFFPSSTDHCTYPNKSNDIRKILSFNLKFLF